MVETDTNMSTVAAEAAVPAQRNGIAPVKKEFLVEPSRAEVGAVQSGVQVQPDDTSNTASAAEDTATQPEQKRRKLTRGQNKHRPVIHCGDAVQLCNQLTSPNGCPDGDGCKYSHDISAYLANKEPDIADVCVHYELHGVCRFGIRCRFASAHSDELGNQKVDESRKANAPPPLLNGIGFETMKALRKYQYKTPRADQVLKEQNRAIQAIKNDPELANAQAEDVEVPLRDVEKRQIDFRGKTYLAPLTTVGNLPFRRICKRFGVDITCGEMAMSVNLLKGQRTEWALTKRHHSEDIFGIQVCGNSPDSLVNLAEVIENELTVDFVDINLGCPIDIVYKKGSGSGLMEHTGKLGRIVRGMNQVLSCPLTIKFRMGIADNKPIAHKMIPRFEKWGCALGTLHGRSRQQRYSRLADWDYIGQGGSLCETMPLFGNGDVLSYEEYHQHLENDSLQGIMIGRGALIKPWIFDEIKTRRHWDISSGERFDILRDFCNYGLEHWGSDTVGVNHTRRYLCEWQSFLHRYIPVGLLEVLPQRINERPPTFEGRNDLETLMASSQASDWIKLSEMLLGPAPADFKFVPKHKANSHSAEIEG